MNSILEMKPEPYPFTYLSNHIVSDSMLCIREAEIRQNSISWSVPSVGGEGCSEGREQNQISKQKIEIQNDKSLDRGHYWVPLVAQKEDLVNGGFLEKLTSKLSFKE
jgi:hypothetical protein